MLCLEETHLKYMLFLSRATVLWSTAGAGGGEAGGHRHHAEAGFQELPAALGAVRHAVWLAARHPRGHQHRVRCRHTNA